MAVGGCVHPRLSSVGNSAKLEVADATTLYYLLYARYGNSSIANSDENQFKYKIFSTIYIGGATWAKKQEIQDKLRAMTEDEILAGTKAINNHAYNPQTAPTTDTVEELNYINEQNTTKYKNRNSTDMRCCGQS